MNTNSTTDKFFNEQSEKSAIKVAIVSTFFSVYLRIILSGISKSKNNLYYIDLFAGPGKYKNGTDSTPMKILDIIESSNQNDLKRKIQCVFNEADDKYYTQLQNNVTSHNVYNRLIHKPIIMNKDAADVDLQPYLNGQSPVFSFIDPFGYKSTSATQIWSLVKNVGSDCVFFFNANRIILDYNKDGKENDFKKIFGTYYSKAKEAVNSNASHNDKMKSILGAFSHNLYDIVRNQNYDYNLYLLPFGFSFDDRERRSHYLLFITKNHKAVMEMKGVMSKLSNNIGAEYNYDEKIVNQISFFKLEDDLYENFLKTISVFRMELCNECYSVNSLCKKLDELSMERYYKVTPFTIKDIRRFVRRLYDNGFLEGKFSFKGNEIFSDNRVIKFKELEKYGG